MGTKLMALMVLYLARREDAKKLLREMRVGLSDEWDQFDASKCHRCPTAGYPIETVPNNRVKCATCGGRHSTFRPGLSRVQNGMRKDVISTTIRWDLQSRILQSDPTRDLAKLA